jgi:cytochrome b subunit of formate dehydrogenase
MSVSEQIPDNSKIPHAQTARVAMADEMIEAPAKTAASRPAKTAKAHLFVTICHWSMVLLITLSLLSGMRLGWGYLESPLGGERGTWAAMLDAIAPKGSLLGINLIVLHVALSFFMLAVVVVYVIYVFRSRASRRMRLTSRDLRKLQDGVKQKNFWRNKPALWSANLIVYWISFLFVILLFITGITMYYLEWRLLDWQVFKWVGGYSAMRLLHALIAYLLIPYTILHMVLQWFFGRFWSIFKAQLYLPHIRAGLIGLVFGITLLGSLYMWNEQPMTLTVPAIPEHLQVPVLDGNASDPVWSYAQARRIRTVKGINNDKDHVDVLVRAVHDRDHVYFLFQWQDQDVSYKRFPLRKTVDGWEVLQTAFDTWDENTFYEDKLAVYITGARNGNCAATCHLGVGPHASKGDKHGVHYTTDGTIGDVWHWKSVRTNNMAGDDKPGYTDDQYFGPSTPIPTELKPDQRYTGGYEADPKTGGGYRYNFIKLASKSPSAGNHSQDSKLSFAGAQSYIGGADFPRHFVQPVKLPAKLDIKPDSNPATTEQGATWWIHDSQGIPYEDDLDKYPVGTLIPNILVEPIQGDRGDVRAKGQWHQGWWTLEVRRALDTGSRYDVPFTFDKPVYISVAAFNRTQTRHSEHIRPLQVVLEKAPNITQASTKAVNP